MGSLIDSVYDDMLRGYLNEAERNRDRNMETMSLITPSLQRSSSDIFANSMQSGAGIGLSAVKAAHSFANAAASASVHALPGAHALAIAGGAVASATPIGAGVVSMIDKLLQLRRYWKTKEHLGNLVLIYLMALDFGQPEELLDAIYYAARQKHTKLVQNGLIGLIPGVVKVTNKYNHLQKVMQGTQGEKQLDAATVLYEYYFEHQNSHAKRTVAELFSGHGSGLEDLAPDTNLDEVEDFGTLQLSDDDLPESRRSSSSSTGGTLSNIGMSVKGIFSGDKTGFSQFADADPEAAEEFSVAGSPKESLSGSAGKALGRLKGKDFVPMGTVLDASNPDRVRRIKAISNKLKSSG